MRLATLCAVLSALVCVLPPAFAQTPDTLDWRRYYPLAVDNVWEYHDAEMWGAQFRHTLVADTVVEGRTYFVRRIDSAVAVSGPAGADTLRATRVDYVRYEEAGRGVVAVASLGADPEALDRCSGDGFERDLGLAFGTRLACDGPAGPFPDSVFVEGQYATVWYPPGSTTPVDVAAVKQFTAGFIFSTFIADVGPVRAGNLWGPELHYAVIGGVAYGTPEMTIEEPGGPLTATDAVAAIPDDREIVLANLTPAPVVLDSLVMRFSDPWGFSTWNVQEVHAPYALCYFAPFLPEMARCAPEVTLAPGAVIQFWVGYDPCAICRADVPAGAPTAARRGGVPDTLLVYSGGQSAPDRLIFDDSGYVGAEEGPSPGALALTVGPNPSAGSASVVVTAAAMAPSARVALFDALGRRVAVLHDGPLGAGTLRLGVPRPLPPGVYVVQADAAGQTATVRLTVVR